MTSKIFSSGRIRQVEYDTTTQALEIQWVDKSVMAYKQVPAEVFRRLCAAPNPAAYWEDRIAEEYPKGIPKAPRPGNSNHKSLSDLFGDSD